MLTWNEQDTVFIALSTAADSSYLCVFTPNALIRDLVHGAQWFLGRTSRFYYFAVGIQWRISQAALSSSDRQARIASQSC